MRDLRWVTRRDEGERPLLRDHLQVPCTAPTNSRRSPTEAHPGGGVRRKPRARGGVLDLATRVLPHRLRPVPQALRPPLLLRTPCWANPTGPPDSSHLREPPMREPRPPPGTRARRPPTAAPKLARLGQRTENPLPPGSPVLAREHPPPTWGQRARLSDLSPRIRAAQEG